jgi:hypothetical protein
MARKPAGGDNQRKPERDDLLWLETYFIMFPHERRPTLTQVEHALAEANPHLLLQNLAADDDGRFASLLVQSPEDHAAVEVSYETGEAVVEQNLEWAKHMQKQLSPAQLQQLVGADARLDVAHFERVPSSGPESRRTKPVRDDSDVGEDDFDDDFDPGDGSRPRDFRPHLPADGGGVAHQTHPRPRHRPRRRRGGVEGTTFVPRPSPRSCAPKARLCEPLASPVPPRRRAIGSRLLMAVELRGQGRSVFFGRHAHVRVGM